MITTAPAATVQLFVATTDADTFRESFDTEVHTSVSEALMDLMGSAKELGWTVTPEVEDGQIVYRIAGEGIVEGLATIS
ncbi:hypothetical protein U2G91_17195 [Rhodococcoides fascians]|uniref:hypothetical protein n=1 Tax=Rhodococcoides fascians TaxID=1828 RepID=UPI002ACEAC97|nr:hypothetical protein [Rhodococcus fascians]WQH26817.1 hypothetical protein U2G91_17195 [Rhodococcus fascians]